MNYIKEAKELVRNLNQRMGPSAYDIGWLARLRNSATGNARWPDLIEWLLENQRPDGSWGGEIVYYHDRIICTLIAIIALRENGHTRQAQRSIERGERYLWHHLHLLPRDPFELVGFELIFPTLLAEALTLGLDVPTHTCGYGEIQTAKLCLIPHQMLYSPRISTVHSLEFLGKTGDPERLRKALTSNGSLGNSPAATAYYLLLLGYDDEKSLAYLEAVQEHAGHTIYLYPFSTFELTWVLNNLTFCGLPIIEFASQDIWKRLLSEVETTGVGLDPVFGIPDADTTSVCVYLLASAGYDVDPLVLAQFEDKERHIFRTYHYERNPSVSTNIHALEALNLIPDYPGRRKTQDQIVVMLLNSRKYNIYWTDKWHASPYYVTAHALVALLRESPYVVAQACRHTVDWIVHTQRDDGSWGFFEFGTAEETAYALTALLHHNRYEPVAPDVLHRGAAYLTRMYQGSDSIYPELWLGKNLYIPRDVVRSMALTALILYDETFGRSP
ncbi:MAG: prenyltransferase/squalene oxidase repeat-containing protein [Chloroflexota bacterium]|nr:prenyltransferase/squalene oxidase repeat-containing protein [Chloroflexota bacterium]